MRRIGTLLLVLVLLVGAAYGLYWYKVKTSIDELVEQVAPFAQVKYGAIYAHPDGTVGVDQLEVTPMGGDEPITAVAVRVRPNSPMYWLTGGEEPPEALSVHLEQLEQGLDGGLLKSMQQQMDLQREANPLHVSPSALGCGDVRQLDINALRGMGYRSLVMDLDLHYSGDQQTRKLAFTIDTDIDNLAKLSFDMRLSADPDQLRNPMQATGTARLEKFELKYTDNGYNARLSNYCSKESGLPAPEYRAEHMRLYEAWLDTNGIEIPDSWLQAYSELQGSGARLTLSLNPIGGFGAGEMMMAQDPVYLIEKVNPAIEVNGKSLSLDGIDWMQLISQVSQAGSAAAVARNGAVQESEVTLDPAEVEAGDMTTASEVADESVVATTARPSRNKDKPMGKSFKQTPKDQLGDHLGAQVRIFTYFGRDVSGQLVAVDSGGIRVSQRLAQGVAEYPLEYERIEQVEVYR